MSQGFMIFDSEGCELDICELGEPLYKSVNRGSWDVALKIAQTLQKNQKGEVIAETVQKLLNCDSDNILTFGYKLWNSGNKQIIVKHFPKEFKLILGKEKVKLINKRDELAVKLALEADYDNDKQCLGDSKDKSSTKVSWNFIPICEDDKMYFKIMNTDSNRYIKLEVKHDSDGDHLAWGAKESDSDRHQWYLDPVMCNDALLFYIYNRHYGQALKLSRAVNIVGDREMWGHNGSVVGNAEHFGWFINAWDC